MRLSFLLLLSVCAWGCAAPPRATVPPPQWPPAPMTAKIVWKSEVGDLSALEPKGWLRRLADVLTGGEPTLPVRPYGVYSDGSGRLLLTDTGGGRVIFLEQGKSPVLLSKSDRGETLQSPIAIAADDAGNYYVTDSMRGSVYRVDPSARTLIRLARLERPTGIAFNPANGLLYVSDTASHQIVALDTGGNERFRIGSRGSDPGQFNFPTDLCVDRKGQLYVTDALNHRVQILTPEGQSVFVFGSEGDVAGYFSKPKGVAVDSEGHIYVVDALLGSVQIFDDAGRLLLAFGTHGTSPGEFWMPSGIGIDAKDDIYVVDTHNRRIQVFSYLREKNGPGFQGGRP